MPGLFGLIAVEPDRKLPREQCEHVLRRMADKLRHQEFYATDEWLDSHGKLAVGRIGHQHLIGAPFSVDGPDGAIFESRHYGVLEKHTAPEARATSQRSCPLMGYAGFRGTFSGISFDKDRSRVALVADRRASEPIYYVINDGVLYFAPEVKALLDLNPDGDTIDPGALASFLTSGHLLPHQTLFSAIGKIPSCQALIVAKGRAELHEYWQYIPGSIENDTPAPELASQLADLVVDSVGNSVESLDETMTFLSGGLDSRYILACLADRADGALGKIHAVTWGEQRSDDDADPKIAEQVARAIGAIDHRFMQREKEKFGLWFREVNFLTDGMSEVPVFHPYEYQIMKSLRDQGFKRVIRGDEAFGYLGTRHTADSALATIGIRPFHLVHHLPGLLRPEWYRRLDQASRADFGALKNRFNELDPTTLKDVIYFSQRVPTYLSQASYYKQILFDQRNPLLSHGLLDFYQSIPNSLRRHKWLFFEAFRLAYPKLATIPYAKGGGLEDWAAIMAGDTPMHHFVQSELNDERSGVWDIFNRQQALMMFAELGRNRGAKEPNPLVKSVRSTVRKIADSAFPARVDAMMAQRSQRRLPVATVLLRLIVIKDWHDRFFSRRIPEQDSAWRA